MTCVTATVTLRSYHTAFILKSQRVVAPLLHLGNLDTALPDRMFCVSRGGGTNKVHIWKLNGRNC